MYTYTHDNGICHASVAPHDKNTAEFKASHKLALLICGFPYQELEDRPEIIIIIISCRLLKQKVDMPQCKLSKDADLEPNF